MNRINRAKRYLNFGSNFTNQWQHYISTLVNYEIFTLLLIFALLYILSSPSSSIANKLTLVITVLTLVAFQQQSQQPCQAFPFATTTLQISCTLPHLGQPMNVLLYAFQIYGYDPKAEIKMIISHCAKHITTSFLIMKVKNHDVQLLPVYIILVLVMVQQYYPSTVQLQI
eukprot:TRINITY_DN19037_c0_g1_i7.p1 TRINITY_DN19037_c0_g1~~TRINITY_DN19037_c0_g1_i7.p1  ORF type:complete len:189 (+),score=-7.89 TRINITY_DN19037_c0_g1_i7:60-569(+)